MKIKQQKQIKAFLIEEFRKDRGSVLFDEQEKVLNTIIKNTKNKSKNQMKTLISTILPRDRKSTRLNSSHIQKSRMPSSA